MSSTPIFRVLGAALLALLCAGLPLEPAHAFAVFFDGPSGYGLAPGTASDAFGAGFDPVPADEIIRASDLGIAIPEPQVLGAALRSRPSVTSPSAVTSVWTVHNDGEASLADVWLVFLKPLTYSPPLVGIDLRADQWGVVQVGSDYEEASYFYPGVFLGDIAAGSSARFEMHHLIGTPLIQEGGKLVLPRYGVGLLAAVVPEPAQILLLGGLLCVLALRRGRME